MECHNSHISSGRRAGILVLWVDYDPSLMFRTNMLLSQSLCTAYDQARDATPNDTNHCILFIEAKTAGSPLVRALFELYCKVVESGGRLICVNYPSEYIESISSLGLPALNGFDMVNTIDEALALLAVDPDAEESVGTPQKAPD